MNPFVSVIIPFNKGKRYLKDCLESLCEENINDIECILIVNGCVEDIDDLIDNYQNDLNLIIKTFDSEINVGKARNEGLQIAKGQYIYFIDSDDYLFDNALSKLITEAKKNNADFINGERINTPYIKDRFNEQLEKPNTIPLKQNKLGNINFSIKLIVGDKTNREELLSALHALIKREKIGSIRFNEDKRYNCDYEFIINVINNIESFQGVEKSIYAKRTRDDPVNLPSLNQEDSDNSFIRYTSEYKSSLKLISHLGNNKNLKQLKNEMNNKLFKYYSTSYTTKFLNHSEDKWRNEYFDIMCDISDNFDINKISSKQRKEIEALQSRDKKALKKWLLFKSRYNKIKKIPHYIKKRDIMMYHKVYNRKRVKENKIIFESFRGDFYSDSPKYIYEYLYNNYADDYEFTWVINDKNTNIPGNPKKVERFSKQYYKEMAESKYWVINGRQPGRLIKKDDQIIISTWHGTPLKKLGLDMENVYTEDPRIKKSYIKVARAWDYLISPNNYTTNILKSAFAYDDGEILEVGYPRNDILYNADENKINQIKSNLNIPEDKKVILYAPTWRDDEFYDVGKVKFQLKLELDKLKKELSDEYIVLVRTHYFIADNLDLTNCRDFAFDVSRYDDIADLYLISDILITDYSSVFFDFANLKRPILFYTYDLEKYENVLRGFYIDIHSEVPGPLLFTTEEVIDNIKNIDLINEEYQEKYDKFYEKFCSIEDGNASKRIVDKVFR